MKSDRTIFPDAHPTSLCAGTADIPFTTCAHNFGFTILITFIQHAILRSQADSLFLNKHISYVCHSAYVETK